jgi:hypothetical protein
MSAQIRFEKGTATVPAAIDEIAFMALKDAMAPNAEGSPVHVQGVGVFDADQNILRIDSISDVAPLDESDGDEEAVSIIEARLAEIASLDEGWLDGLEGTAPTEAILTRVRQMLIELLNRDVPRPRLFPTPDGGVQAEWTSGHFEISVEFEPNGALYVLAVDTASGECVEENVEYDDVERLAGFVLSHGS